MLTALVIRSTLPPFSSTIYGKNKEKKITRSRWRETGGKVDVNTRESGGGGGGQLEVKYERANSDTGKLRNIKRWTAGNREPVSLLLTF